MKKPMLLRPMLLSFLTFIAVLVLLAVLAPTLPILVDVSLAGLAAILVSATA